MSTSVPTLDLVLLERGNIPAITASMGRTMVEACVVCLEEEGHQGGVALTTHFTDGPPTILPFTIAAWEGVTEQMRRAYNDFGYTVEQAAYGIAIVLVHTLTEHTVIERSRKGTGVDYFLGRLNNDDYSFTRTARLEVSGILHGNPSEIKARVRIKLRQTQPTDHLPLPVYIAVVEFGTPVAHMVKKS